MKKKLTSRKLWVSIASFVSLLIIAFGYPQATATQITALIMAGATVIGYVIGEGLVDSAAATPPTTPVVETLTPDVPDVNSGADQAATVKQQTALSVIDPQIDQLTKAINVATPDTANLDLMKATLVALQATRATLIANTTTV